MAARLKDMVALISSERDRFSVTLSNMADGIVVVDGESRVTLVNRAAEAMFEVTEAEAAQNSFVNVVRDYELDDVLQRCLRSREQQAGMVETSRAKRSLGIVATPLKENPGCLLLIRDLTEFRRLESVRRDFISNISHELRTPLASLKALAETLREGALDDTSVAKDFLGKMTTEVDRLAQMVDELGELSRIESGDSPIRREFFNAAGTIEQAAARLRAQAERAGVHLDSSIPPDLPQAIGDRERVERVLINLIHNAIKFTDAGGSITVSAETEGGNLRVSVADTGIGIPADDLPRIFERFYKADKARTGSGTGLGLAIAKHIVEAHGGAIWAESTEGRGSVFSFSLPLS
jgi:two-component system phosphate regulon sensor histidine kinase PhoR